MLGFDDVESSDESASSDRDCSGKFGSKDFGRSAPTTVVHTAIISIQSDNVHISMTNIAGQTRGPRIYGISAKVQEFKADLIDMFQWLQVSFFSDDGVVVDKETHLKNYARLTIRAYPQRTPRRTIDASQQFGSNLPQVRSLELKQSQNGNARYIKPCEDISEDVESSGSSSSEETHTKQTFGSYAKNPRWSKFVDSVTGAEISPDSIDLHGVKSLLMKGLKIHIKDFRFIESSFPCLECFEYSVAHGNCATYDLRGLANPLWSQSLKTLRLHLGPCHILENVYGLEVLCSLANLETFDVSHFRHGFLKDLKVVENFSALVELSFGGSIDTSWEEGAALDLSKHSFLRKIKFKGYGSNLNFCAPGERRGIQLYLPFLTESSGTSVPAGKPPVISLQIINCRDSMLTKRLRDAVDQSCMYKLEEFFSAGFNNTLEAVSFEKMNDVWRQDFLERTRREEENCRRRIQHETESRLSIVEFFNDEQSALESTLFAAPRVCGLRSDFDVLRWVKYSDLRRDQSVHYNQGDKCFLLALVGNKHGRLDFLTGDWMFHHSNPSSCSFCFHQGASNIDSILRTTPEGAKGLFMVECQVQKKRLSASAKLAALKIDMVEEGSEDAMAQHHSEDYEYSVVICSSKGNGRVAGSVHESLLFSNIPSEWTSTAELSIKKSNGYQEHLSFFPVSLPPDNVLKGALINRSRPLRDLALHKRRRVEDTP